MNSIRDHEALRRFRIANPKHMHSAIEAAFLRGYVVGMRQEHHRRGELERSLGKLGLSMADYNKYGGTV